MSWKLIGMILSGVGAALSIVSGIVEDRKMEETIREEVSKEFAKREEDEETV